MSADEKSDSTNTVRPFQLRPSILSGTGFGSPFSSGAGSVGDKQSKGFMLRPSALTSAADKIDSQNKSDSRKRQSCEREGNNDSGEPEEIIKKQKISDEENGTKSTTVSAKEPHIKLTEDIEKPTGIGSFGFDQKNGNVDSAKRNSLDNTQQNTNYFAQTVKENDKLGFVFGYNSGSATLGFGTLKKDETSDVSPTSTTTPTQQTAKTSANTNENTSDTGESSNEEALASGAETTVASDGGTPAAAAPFNKSASQKTLLENASEYEKTHNNKQHYEEIDKFTGEEGEQHVLHIFCKLHVFDKDKKNWLERGRGNLKLNDKCQADGCFQSRLVFRTQGTNLVQLNTKLWPDMCCEKVKERSIRISALDPETKDVKVYLITASMKDVLQAFTAIDRRVSALKRNRSTSEEHADARYESSNDPTKASSENEDEDEDDDEDDDSSDNEQQKNKRQTSSGAATDSKTENLQSSPDTKS